MNYWNWKKTALFSLASFAMLGASAQDGDAKVIQYMDFLQHQDLIKNQELVSFYAAVSEKRPAPSSKSPAKKSTESAAAQGSTK
jgi:hypothetical protein